jgi:hypothetical protein
MNKSARDNRSRQLNSKDVTYHSSRGLPPPSGTETPAQPVVPETKPEK